MLALPGVASAQLTLSGGTEYFNWEENTSPSVSEEGMLLTLGLQYTQQADSGFLFGYRGKLWTGNVDYTGSTLFTNMPINGSTGYLGLTNEVQMRYRKGLKNDYRRDLIASLGLDIWRRELSSVQREDYKVIFARAGFEIDSVSPKSWLFGFGLKYPLWISEDAHLTDIGFDRNPELNPDGQISAYGQVGYRFSKKWNIVGYFDGYRMDRSNAESVNEVARGFGAATVFQPASDMQVIGIRLDRTIR